MTKKIGIKCPICGLVVIDRYDRKYPCDIFEVEFKGRGKISYNNLKIRNKEEAEMIIQIIDKLIDKLYDAIDELEKKKMKIISKFENE
ncbi:hypothetical protein [Methanocaldococcus sp.]